MTVQCKCGGRFRRTDIQAFFDRMSKRMMYRDTDDQKANWKCTKCGAIRTQRKRQSIRQQPMTKIIRAPWDGRLDYEIPLSRAKQLYEEGKISWDSTNGAYTTYSDWQYMRTGDKIE